MVKPYVGLASFFFIALDVFFALYILPVHPMHRAWARRSPRQHRSSTRDDGVCSLCARRMISNAHPRRDAVRARTARRDADDDNDASQCARALIRGVDSHARAFAVVVVVPRWRAARAMVAVVARRTRTNR